MLKKTETENLNDYFIDLEKRKEKGVYFYRINGYNRQIHDFLYRYYEQARLNGVIIEGKLQNPDNNNLAYYNEIMGSSFYAEESFIEKSLEKWLPRMTASQVKNVALSIYNTLMDLRKKGKNDNMLKNAYIKFMCWLYYKFERIVNHLGDEKLPKILYEGSIGIYELLLMDVLSKAGCDIVILQRGGEEEYLKADDSSSLSYEFKLPQMTAFPENSVLKQIGEEIRENVQKERLYGGKPKFINCTNAWLGEDIFDDIEKMPSARGNDDRFFYNVFCRITGVEDKLTYQNELYKLYMELKNAKRKTVVVDNVIDVPTVEEIKLIKRNNYTSIGRMIWDLSLNIDFSYNAELNQIIKKAFVDILNEEGRNKDENINRLTNKAVYILCWIKRYYPMLFSNWKMPEIAVFFYMGGCKNKNEALFCKFLSRLPVDVVIFNPNLNQKCCLEDDLLYEIHNDFSMAVDKYPQENAELRVETAAYQAERELDDLMYKDSGIYRNQQYTKANAVVLKTAYEEIPVWWNEELKYRPNFSTVDDVVNMPVMFSKISGVKNGSLPIYWAGIKELITDDTTVIKKVPSISSISPNPLKQFATEFYRNGRLQKTKIKQHKAYKYGFLREAMQDYILEKLQFLIDQRIIKGTFENGTEYTIVSVALNLDKDILRQIQKFDFTKKNPKLIYIITGENVLSLEDSIYAAFLNIIGFDVLFFVPTGYQSVEKYFNSNIIEEHQTGEYMYDLHIPDFDKVSSNVRPSWRDKIFKRGV